MTDHNLGELIRDRRTFLGLSQSDLALRIGLDQTLISKVENEKYPFPVSYVRLLADSLNLKEMEVIKALLRSRGVPFDSEKDATNKFERLLGLNPVLETTDVSTPSRRLRKVRSQYPLDRQGPTLTPVTIPVLGSVGRSGATLPVNDLGIPTETRPELSIGSLFAAHQPEFAVELDGSFLEPNFVEKSRLIAGKKHYLDGDPVFLRTHEGKCYVGYLNTRGETVSLVTPQNKAIVNVPRESIVLIKRIVGAVQSV
jgi:transcriptional regulator with XRE-family HTH domain